MIVDVRYYLAIFRRRFHYFALAFVAVSTLAITAALKLPPSYESQARLLLESAQIPDTLAAPTVRTADLEQLQVIEQRLMTRENLLAIARKFRVFPKIDKMSPDEIVSAMQDETRIDNQAGRDQATLMTIGFTADTAQAAAAVVNEYVTRILSDSVSMRTGQAQQTLDFFRQQVDRLSGDLSTQSAKIQAFQNTNRDALPNTLNYRLNQQSNLQERLSSVEREVADLKDQKQRLIQLYHSTGQVAGTQNDAALSPEARALTQLRSQLAQDLAVLSETNPNVVLLKSKIAQLEATVKSQDAAAAEAGTGSGADSGTAGPGPASQLTLLDIQTSQIDSRISQLERQHDEIVKQLATLKDSIDRTANNAITLEGLQRDYDNIQSQYNTAVDRLSTASTGERIEALSKGQRLTVLDAATAPDAPTKPNRRKIAALGFVAGIVLGIGLIVLRELFDTSVRRPSDLTRALGITPIGTIPYIRSPGERLRRRTVLASVLLLLALGVPASMYAVDTYYMPLDLIAAKISKKLGI